MKGRTIFGAYEPDKAPFLTDGLMDMANAYPRANGYKPVGSFEPVTPSLPAPFFGGGSFIASDHSGYLIAGTEKGLYRYLAGSWNTLLSLAFVSSRWRMTQFGDAAITVNGGVTNRVDLQLGTATALTGAPSARSVATVRDFVVYGQANGNGALVQWSGFNNETQNTPGQNQAGYQPMLTGGDIQNIAGGEYGLILQRNRIVRMTYTGDDFVWQFDEISPNIGCSSAGSMAQAGRQVFFLSDRGFMVCDGTDVRPIGNQRVDATIFELYSRQMLEGMYATVDPQRNVVAWAIPGSPGLLLIYDWVLDKWSPIRLNLAAAVAGYTQGTTLEQLDALYPLGIDSMPYSLDDSRWAGGDPLLIVVDDQNAVGTLSGDNLAAYFSTPLIQISDEMVRLRKVRPLADIQEGVSVTLDCRRRLGDGPMRATYTVMQSNGEMPVRASGRYVGFRLDMDAGINWSFSTGMEHVYEAGGGR